MAVKKVNIANLPKDKLEELKPLLQAQPEYAPIGESVYEIYPIPATQLLLVISDLIKVVTKIQDKKIKLAEAMNLGDEEKREFIKVTTNDILSDEEAVSKLKEILRVVLDGVDEDDFNKMNTGQLINLLDVVVKVNINTLPPSVKEKLFSVAEKTGINVNYEANQGN